MPSTQQIENTIDEILSLREFGQRKSLLQRIIDKIAEAINDLIRNASEMTGIPAAIIVLLLAACIFLIVFLLIRLDKGRRLSDISPDGSESGVQLDPLWLALDFAEKEDYRAAVVCLFLLHLEALDSGGWILLEKSKTSLQYELELMGNGYTDIRGFRAFRDEFNNLRYGGYGSQKEAFEKWLSYSRSPVETRCSP